MSCHLSIARWERLELRFCRARIPRTDNNKQSFLEGGATSLFTAEQSSAYSTTSKKLPTAKGAPVCAAGGRWLDAPSHGRAPSPTPPRLRPVTQPYVIQIQSKPRIFS